MNKRLDMLYRMLPKESRGIIDVGTDHAQIPIRLAEEGFPGNILASDIAQSPLSEARRSACEHGVGNRIRFLCCDGLTVCPPGDVDTILIAGMGGDTICGILDRTEWLFEGSFFLVLQPMTHAEVLRYWLVHNEFIITREAVIAESGHVYQMFCACLGASGRYSDSEYLTGKRDALHAGNDRHVLLRWERDRLLKKTEGIRRAGQMDSPTFRFYENIRREMEEDLNDTDR